MPNTYRDERRLRRMRPCRIRYRLTPQQWVFRVGGGHTRGRCIFEVSKKGRITCVGPHGPSGPRCSRPSRSASPHAAAATTLAEARSAKTTRHDAAQGQKPGGKLTVLWTGDVDHIDCGQTYYQMGYFICNATQKPLYSYKPDDRVNMMPDLAEGEPQVSEDGKTVTVKIKPGVKYSPPYNKEVTSADVKYAIERGFFTSVASGFTRPTTRTSRAPRSAWMRARRSRASRRRTTDARPEVQARGRRRDGRRCARVSATAPVPEEYAEKFDAETPSTYGENQLATGPYMIENDAEGKAIGYEPGKRIHLVRNPNWDKTLDYRPAYLDEIENLEGNDDPGVASRRILTGESMVNGDFAPLPET